MNTAWSTPTKYLAGGIAAAFCVFVLYLSRSVVASLIVAALIAVVLHPIIRWLHGRVGMCRGVAVAVVYLGLAILVPLGVALVVPVIGDTLQRIGPIDSQSILARGTAWLRETLTATQQAQLPIEALDDYVDRTIDVLLPLFQNAGQTTAQEAATPQTIISSLVSALTTTLGAVASLVGTVGSAAATLIFIVLASVYLSLSGHTYADALLRLVPAAYQPQIGMLVARIIKTWSALSCSSGSYMS